MSEATAQPDRIDESDRGCVLVAVADIEAALERLLRLAFSSHRARKKIVDSLFGAMAPLGSFSAKLRIAHALGLVSPTLYDDVDFLRKLRNEAAHSSSEFDVLTHPMAPHIETLHCVQAFKSAMPRYSVAKSRPLSPSSSPKHSPRHEEARLRFAGFVKARKSYLVLGAAAICIEINATCASLARQATERPARAL